MSLTLLCPHNLPASSCSTCCDEGPYRTPDEYVAWIADRRATAEMACGPEPDPDPVFADTQTPEPARVTVVHIGPGLLLAAIIVAVALVWRTIG